MPESKRIERRTSVIFDFDGTLVDTVSIAHSIMTDLAQKYGFRTVSRNEIDDLRNLPAADVLQHLEIPWYLIPIVVFEGKRALRKRINEVPLVARVTDLIYELKDHKVFLGIVTGNSARTVSHFLNIRNIDCFEFIHSSRGFAGKGRALIKALKRYGLDRRSCLYVGDEVRDIQAANLAGITSLSVTWGYNSAGVLREYNPGWVVESVDELKRRLLDFSLGIASSEERGL